MQPEPLFSALSDPTRLRCLMLLQGQGELCVCELTHALGLPQPKISHHLGVLRRSGLVRDRKQGLWIHYRIRPDLPDWIRDVLATTARGAADDEPFAGDARKLDTMADRPGDRCGNPKPIERGVSHVRA